ncbi:MAG TPA: hypothetical protein VIH79_03355, partial [Candidatus Nanopelagicaceae bacterium]
TGSPRARQHDSRIGRANPRISLSSDIVCCLLHTRLDHRKLVSTTLNSEKPTREFRCRPTMFAKNCDH